MKVNVPCTPKALSLFENPTRSDPEQMERKGQRAARCYLCALNSMGHFSSQCNFIDFNKVGPGMILIHLATKQNSSWEE